MADTRIAPWIVQSLTRLYGTVTIFYGLTFVAQNPVRLNGPSFSAIVQFPGAPETLGYTLFIAGSMTMIGSLLDRRPLAQAGLALMGLWFILIGWQFAVAFQKNPTAGITAPFAYALLVGTTIVLLVGNRRE